MLANCKPIATESRQYSKDDRDFIRNEVEKSLTTGIIEPSVSPWCAQVIVTKDDNHKKRVGIDYYSQTVNRSTLLDAYPLPYRIDKQVNQIARYRFFSTVDLKSAY